MTWWWLCYVAFVVYGSLVPLDFRPAPWAAAWQAFGGIRLLDVGPGGRADWVANGVLYVPVGFLTASLLASGRRKFPAALVGAMGFGVVLALLVEFAQVFFPPRTVSVNDLVAELIGSVVGAALAAVAGRRFHMLLAVFSGAADRLAPALLKAYALVYCAFSLFPYDFLLSAGELAEKFGSGRWGWLWAEVGGRGGGAAAVAKLAAEALAALPLGWLLAGRGATPGRALGAGAALGVAIEFAQFFLVSGVTQGVSVLTRALGAVAGAVLWRRRGSLDPLRLAAAIRRHGAFILGLYLLALAAVTGWFELPWLGVGAAAEGLREVRFLPFYYHYYTTEQAALLSLTSVGLMYAPLGVLAWAWFMGAGAAAGMAVPIALGMETSKLFLAGLHPDPTNVLLAGVAAWLGCRLAMAAERWSVGPARGLGGRRGSSGPIPAARGADASASTGEAGGARSGAPGLRRSRAKGGLQTDRPAEGAAEPRPLESVPAGLAPRAPRGRALLGLLTGVALVAWGVVGFPVQPVLLGLGLAGYGVALWFRPHYLWVAVPAALPLLDLAPWSGRFFVDEFDFLLLVSLAVGYARLAPPPPGRRDPLPTMVLALVGVAYGVSALRGLLPWQAPDLNAFSHYYSPFNALRIAKGALGAFLLLGLAGRFAAAGADVVRLFGTGMVIGLAGTVAVVVWERAAFPGLFNFTDVYRVTGPFSQMHVGGADLEAYLTVAVAFLAHFLVTRLTWPERVLGLALLLGASYTVMVTFSRAGYAGFAVALLVAVGVGLAGAAGRTWRGWLRRGATAVVLLAAVQAVALPILLGSFAQARLARVGADLALRQAHWADALAMRDPGLATRLFGMGLGRYPETHHWRSLEARAASYRLAREGDNTFLRLGSGSPIYVEQFVATRPRQTYDLSLRARSPAGAASLNISLCEKWLLTSARCVFRTLDLPAGAEWATLRSELASGEVGEAPWYAPRPVKLSITNAIHSAVVEVDAMTLNARDGAELLENGEFSAGLDRWFFSADVDLPWHIWSLPVAALFEMGWLGGMALGSLTLLALLRAVSRAGTGNPWAATGLAAILGLGTLGVVDSLGDAPRTLLLSLFVMFCVVRSTPEREAGQSN